MYVIRLNFTDGSGMIEVSSRSDQPDRPARYANQEYTVTNLLRVLEGQNSALVKYQAIIDEVNRTHRFDLRNNHVFYNGKLPDKLYLLVVDNRVIDRIWVQSTKDPVARAYAMTHGQGPRQYKSDVAKWGIDSFWFGILGPFDSQSDANFEATHVLSTFELTNDPDDASRTYMNKIQYCKIFGNNISGSPKYATSSSYKYRYGNIVYTSPKDLLDQLARDGITFTDRISRSFLYDGKLSNYYKRLYPKLVGAVERSLVGKSAWRVLGV